MSDLIRGQTVCKGYQQMTKVTTSRERLNRILLYFVLSLLETAQHDRNIVDRTVKSQLKTKSI